MKEGEEGEVAGDEDKRKRTNEEEDDDDDKDGHKRTRPDEEESAAETEDEKEKEARKRKRESCEVASGLEDGGEEEEKRGEPPRKQSCPNPVAAAADPAPPFQDGPLQQHQQQQQHQHQHQQHQQQQHQQQQQLQLVKVGDWTVVRCTETQENILRIVHEYLPSLVDRLIAFHRRSEAHDADRNHCINRARQSPPLFGGADGLMEKKELTKMISYLAIATQGLRKFHTDGGDRYYALAAAPDYDSDITWNTQRLRVISRRTIELRQRQLELLEVHDKNEDREQVKSMNEIRIILYDAVYFDQRMAEPPIERQDSGPFDLPIRDVWELIKVVSNEIRQAFDYVEELKKWVEAYKDPPTPASAAGPSRASTSASGAGLSTTATGAGPTPASGAGPSISASGAGPSIPASGAGPSIPASGAVPSTTASGAGPSATAATAATAATLAERAVRLEAVHLCDQLAKFCNDKLVGRVEFLVQRSQLAKAAWQKPPAERDRMRDVNAFEVTQSVEWRRIAFALVEKCERLLEFAERHIRVLEQ